MTDKQYLLFGEGAVPVKPFKETKKKITPDDLTKEFLSFLDMEESGYCLAMLKTAEVLQQHGYVEASKLFFQLIEKREGNHVKEGCCRSCNSGRSEGEGCACGVQKPT